MRRAATEAGARGIAIVEGMGLARVLVFHALLRLGSGDQFTTAFFAAFELVAVLLVIGSAVVQHRFAQGRRESASASMAEYAFLAALAVGVTTLATTVVYRFGGASGPVQEVVQGASLVVGLVADVTLWLALAGTAIGVTSGQRSAWLVARGLLFVVGALAVANLWSPRELGDVAEWAWLVLDVGLRVPVIAFAWRISTGAYEAGPQATGAVRPSEAGPTRASSANSDLWVGGLWLAGGLLVTTISYASAEGGGRFVVTSGAIVYGLFRLGRGVLAKVG